VGLGYLGRHAAEIARELGGEVPRVYGVVDGVMIRDRMAGEGNAGGANSRAVGEQRACVPPEVVADYVDYRRRALPVREDRSVLLGGRQPVWEIAARILARGFGRLGTPVRPLLVDPLTRALSESDQPCLVDGDVHPGLWHSDDLGGWAKTAFADGCFSHLDLASYDALYDLAAAAVAEPESEDRLLARYEKASGECVSASRWCVYKLVHAWNMQRRGGGGARLQQAGAVRRFLTDLFLADLDVEPQGPWCALDVDGCLENDVFGFSVSSPSGVLALRALRAHGFRVVLSTGRPLSDVRERCAAYRLFGAVAEYGAVLFEAETGHDTALVPDSDGELAEALGAMPGVSVDGDYRCCVRAFRGGGGRRRGLADADWLGMGAARDYAVVEGDGQTDFLPRGIGKVEGVRELIKAAGGGDQPLALAVGDRAPDIGMLRAAELGFAPGNADRALMASAGVRVLRHSYQAGLAQAVGRLIGHRVGGCPVCRAPKLGAEDRALLALLAVPEAGRIGMPARAAKLAVATRRLAGQAGMRGAAARAATRQTGSRAAAS
jgi:hydroxymethylpyrimidine pyrophosphatase-like HAD family hydrolase